jgi:SAM-dependent methyltransferase
MLWPDVIDLKSFYSSALGQVTCQTLRQRIKRIWPKAEGETLVGIGYTPPLLLPWLDKSDLTIACMPVAQGVVHWPQGRSNLTLLTDETALPLHDGTVNRTLLVHALENTEQARKLLAEAHRLLTPSGRMLVIIPNRRGLWARSPRSPFAHGHPFSTGQLKALMRECHFTPLHIETALFYPPSSKRSILRAAKLLEWVGRTFFPLFGGIIIMEVEKRIFAPTKGTLSPAYQHAGRYKTASVTNFDQK